MRRHCSTVSRSFVADPKIPQILFDERNDFSLPDPRYLLPHYSTTIPARKVSSSFVCRWIDIEHPPCEQAETAILKGNKDTNDSHETDAPPIHISHPSLMSANLD